MCGRYTLKQAREAEEYFRTLPSPWQQSFNIAPTQPVAVVRMQGDERIGVNMRWGLSPMVNSPKNNDAALLERIDPDAAVTSPF